MTVTTGRRWSWCSPPAVPRLPEKEAIVDNGAHFDGDQSGTVNGVTPPAVQHLTAEVTADSGEYQV
ncbi:hypothetical protein FCZ58_27250, partial [Escherichia coli]|nr:hypothetical protein [Escherichia coli]